MGKLEAKMRAKESERLISEVNKKAEAAGLSYGKYVALKELSSLHKIHNASNQIKNS